MKSSISHLLIAGSLVLSAAPLCAQTFEINGQSPQQQAPSSAGKRQKGTPGQNPASGQSSIGWGSSIEVGRLARAAEDALHRGNYSSAVDYAQRAVNAAPGDNKLWFLLGYTARLAGRYPVSVEAYQHGLQVAPGNPDGMSGLAETYARMGRIDDAKRVFLQVIRANPNRTNDLTTAGELFLQAGDTREAINLFQRAETQQPNARTELMLAVGYMKIKQPDRAKQMLDVAKKRAPNNPEIFQAVANYYREEHDYKAAIETLKSAPRPSPALLADLGYTYELDGDKQESVEAYSRAANGQPKDIGYQLSAAQAEVNLGDNEKARGFLARAAAIDPNHYRLHAIRAVLARSENRNTEAIQEYNTAIAAIPPGGVPEGQLYPILLRLNLAELYRANGDERNAHQQIAVAQEQIGKIDVQGPAKAEFLRVRASIESEENNLQAAEKDLIEARNLDPANTNITLQYANLLWKEGRKADSQKIYQSVLDKDPKNRFALEAMGYLYREDNNPKMAEAYFNKLAEAYPNDFVPYLALGDLFTATKEFARANDAYEKAYKLNPDKSVIVANAANAALEAHDTNLAGSWVNRASTKMNDDPLIMRERERYLFHQGNFQESAALGYKVLEAMPADRNASVYLAYDLYNLGRYDETLTLANKYEGILPKEPNFPLLAGHVHKQSQLLSESIEDYTRAITRDPNIAEEYINRGYVYNDMQNAQAAEQDFEQALKLSPNNGVAHLGLAFSDLQLRRSKEALNHADEAQKFLGESGAVHLARATAFRQQRLLGSAENEYRAALKYAPDDLHVQLALADTLYHMRRYQESIDALNGALRLSPNDPLIYAQLAHANAELHRRDDTLRYVQAAEREGGDQSAILLDTGDALLTLGDREGAMDRFSRALAAPDANRVDVRLAIASLMVRYGQEDDAKQQISLGFAESRIGEAPPVTADNLIEAANLLLAMHDFDLATRYFEKAKQAGAADEVVAIGLANTYLAQGKTRQADEALSLLGSDPAANQNYDYLLAQSGVYRQRQDNRSALSVLARANQMGAENTNAEQALQQVAGDEGYRLTRRLSVLSNFSMGGLYDDSTIYMLDRQIFGLSTTNSQLPPPRSQLESLWTTGYRLHFDNNFPMVSGFFQMRNARGDISLPQEARIINRDTWDYNFNSAINPVIHLGSAALTFNTGLQFTVRRDKRDPVEMNQNLFRQYAYVTSTSFGNWLAFRGDVYHESGPFTELDLHSTDVGGRIEFTVGRPWGKTALITGYTRRDLTFSPLAREFFTTSTYAGIQRKVGQKLTFSVLGEYIRSWRVQDALHATAQALRPGGTFEYRANRSWSVDGQFAYTRGESFQQYDNVFSSFFISYLRPLRQRSSDANGVFSIEYPLRFSVGVQAESFPSFSGAVSSGTMVRPVIRVEVF